MPDEKNLKEVVIEKLAFGGEGIGHVEGKVVFVPYTAPGDRVRYRMASDEKRFERGEIVEILEKGSDRVSPRCSVFELCGGCHWQHLSYKSQLRAKEEILKETLHRVTKNFELLPILPAESPWNYRNRIQLKSDGRSVGFYGRGNHRVVPFERCEIAHPLLNERVKKIREGHEELGETFELCLEEEEEVRSFRADDTRRVFSQVNPAQNQKLREEVVRFVFGRAEEAFTRQKNVVELYAGEGNLTFSLALRAGQVVAVEENRAAAYRLVESCLEKKLTHVECVTGTAEWGLKKLYRRRYPTDILVLDPPRGGASELLDLVLMMKPRLVVYVSCDPMTLARDIKILTRGYRLAKVRPIDMFPQTYHIESVSELVRTT